MIQGGYFKLNEAYDFVKTYKTKYPGMIVNLTEFGRTVQDNPMYLFGITEIGMSILEGL